MTITVTILGCGASGGVPLIGCTCSVCQSDNPKNKRSRVSVLVESETTRVLIDMAPDLRMQALAHHIDTVDAILCTHFHADHIMGIDDVRSFNFHRDNPIPIYSNATTIEALKNSFSYIFQPPIREHGWFRPSLEPHTVAFTPETMLQIGDIEIQLFSQTHGKMETMGVRIGDFAYSTDVNKLDEESLQALENTKIWVVDCLQYDPAPTHAHLELTLSWIERINPERAILTHMNHMLDFDTLSRELPKGVEPAYDGMRFTI